MKNVVLKSSLDHAQISVAEKEVDCAEEGFNSQNTHKKKLIERLTQSQLLERARIVDLEISDIKLSKESENSTSDSTKVEELLSQKKEDLAIMRHDLMEHFNYIKYELDADVLMHKRKTLKTKLRSLNKNSIQSEFQKSSNESDEGKSEHKTVVKGFRLLRPKRNLMKQLHLIQDIRSV